MQLVFAWRGAGFRQDNDLAEELLTGVPAKGRIQQGRGAAVVASPLVPPIIAQPQRYLVVLPQFLDGLPVEDNLQLIRRGLPLGHGVPQELDLVVEIHDRRMLYLGSTGEMDIGRECVV